MGAYPSFIVCMEGDWGGYHEVSKINRLRPLLMLPKNRPEKVGFPDLDKIGLLMLPDSLLFRVNFFWDQLFGRASSGKQGIFRASAHPENLLRKMPPHTQTTHCAASTGRRAPIKSS